MVSKSWLAALVTGAMAAPLPSAAESQLDALGRTDSWLNSAPLTAADLRGKVVLIDFWTYTCINWLRTAPYVRAWAEKYRSQGLVVIGVHTPEFAFEHDIENVRVAVRDLAITYPVAVDNGYDVWRAFDNNAWPALYFIDAQGSVRFRHLGEGAYEEAERTIQALLADSGRTPHTTDLVSVSGVGIEAEADWSNLKSPETYLGYERTARFASLSGPLHNARRNYELPERLGLNRWALSGNWTMRAQAVSLNHAGGRIAYRFHARDLHLVMGPSKKDTVVRFRVKIDGHEPGAAHGGDIDAQGNGTVDEQRVYQLIRQPSPIVEQLFEIEFLEGQVEAFAFTFG
jgi:thiol-disulfide isomerase/thioredoxin